MEACRGKEGWQGYCEERLAMLRAQFMPSFIVKASDRGEAG